MYETMEKQKRQEARLILFLVIFFMSVIMGTIYYLGQKEQQDNNSSTNEVVTTQSEPQPITAVANEHRTPVLNPAPVVTPERRLPTRSTPRRQQALLKCTDPRTGTVSLAKTCPPGFTAEKIETQDHAGIRPSRYRHTQSTNQTQQGQITVIRDYRREVEKCDAHYDPLIKNIMDNYDYMFNQYWKKRLNKLRELKDKCVQAANRGKAIIYPL